MCIHQHCNREDQRLVLYDGQYLEQEGQVSTFDGESLYVSDFVARWCQYLQLWGHSKSQCIKRLLTGGVARVEDPGASRIQEDERA